MSYNGIGLSTPRGSGTNGHITRNLSNPRPRDFFNKNEKTRENQMDRAPDQGILEHERRRRVEVKCLELQVSLEDDGVNEEEIEKQVAALREKLLAQSAGKSGTDREGSIQPHQRHELGQAKAIANERLRVALGIGKDHVEGAAFDQELQAELKIKREEQRAKEREERSKIEAQLRVDREKMMQARDAERRRHQEEMDRQRRMHQEELEDRRRAHAERMRREDEYRSMSKEDREKAEIKRLDAELDARKRSPSPGRGPRGTSSGLKRSRSPEPYRRHQGGSRSPPPSARRRGDYSPERRYDSDRRYRRDRSLSPRRSASPPPPQRSRRSPSPYERRRGRSPSRSRSPSSSMSMSRSPSPARSDSRDRSPRK